MGLMRFLWRQFGGLETRAEPVPASAARSTPASPTAPELMLPARWRSNVPAPPRAASGTELTGPAAGEAVLHFTERRDARFATFADPDVRSEILRLHEMINQLHRQRRRLREDRDKWERLARELERELVATRRAGQHDTANPLLAADKFRRAKLVLARLTHPDTNGATGVEAGIRAAVFREFWAEFERIEADASARSASLVPH